MGGFLAKSRGLTRVRLIFLAWMFASVGFAEPVVVDRILLKINESAFTQRELENYMLVKAIRRSNRELVASQQNWESSVQFFKDDMLVYEESRKLRYPVEASTKIVEDARNIFVTIQTDSELKSLADRLLLSEKAIQNILRMMLRVEKFKVEQRDTAMDVIAVPQKKRVPFLEKRNFIRMYDEAMTYKRIEPSAFKFNK